MIAYARLGTMGDARIGALVTVASPGFFAPASGSLLRFGQLSAGLALLPALPTSGPAAIDAKLHLPVTPDMLKSTILESSNMPDETYRRLEENAVNDGSKRELRQLLLGIRRGEFVSADGSVSYTQGLSAIHAPTLVVVGRADELADPLVGRGVYERLGSTDKELLVAGKAEGFSVDFGHVDLLIGPAARHEVFPRIVAWLEAHQGP
jgi:polyhydroxyalkanoate synthase